MLTAYDVSGPLTTESEYKFSIDRDRMARELRDLASAIEDGSVLVQRIEVKSVADSDDFPATVLTYYDKRINDKPPHQPSQQQTSSGGGYISMPKLLAAFRRLAGI
jgi:hypothetical protein